MFVVIILKTFLFFNLFLFFLPRFFIVLILINVVRVIYKVSNVL